MLSIFKITRILVLSSIITINAAHAQESKVVKIDSLLKRANQLGLFNGNVLVADGNRVIYKTALGFTDASKKTILTDQYRFHIGSIAKEFNAVGIMILKEQGKLSLDDKIAKYLPGLPAWANKISIKNLLQYTSGLPDVKWRSVKTDADNMADLQKLDKLDFEPGTSYAYNNNNVFLQRRIIEKISGIPFNEFVKRKMLIPCNMSTAIIDPTEKDSFVAKAYSDDGKQDELTYPISGWTAVTLDDFYKWAQCIAQFRLISIESTRQILIPVGPNKQSGLGGGSMEGDKLITHIHDGTSLHYQALQITNVPAGRTIILMTNNKQENLFDLSKAINAILDGKPYQQPMISVLKVYQKQFETMNGAEILAFLKDLQAKHPHDYGFDNESTLNEIGYFLMSKKLSDAIIIFEYNTLLFPASGNVYDSLGEAYNKQGDKQKALINYKKSFQLDPSNTAAKDIIAELEK
jgi:CubicO group peptidase (beta-lactamase class C family)